MTATGAADRVPLSVALTLGRRARLVVEGLSPSEAQVLRAAWSRCLAPDAAPDEPCGPPGAAVRVRRDPQAEDWDAFHEELTQQATRQVVDDGRGSQLMLHAAALDRGPDGAVVLVAASGTGKTTASRRLGRTWGYLSDETAVVDPQSLLITPYPKPLSVLGPSGRRPKHQCGPDELGLAPTTAARLTTLALLERIGADDPRPVQAHRLPMAEALSWLVPQSSSQSSLDRGLCRLIDVIRRADGALLVRYREASDLPGLLAVEALPAPDRRHLDAQPLPAAQLSPRGAPAQPGMIRRVAVRDAVELPGDPPRLALLREDSLAQLSGIGPALWHACRGWREEGDLVRELAAHPEAPADAPRLVREGLDQLVSEGLLERAGDPPA